MQDVLVSFAGRVAEQESRGVVSASEPVSRGPRRRGTWRGGGPDQRERKRAGYMGNTNWKHGMRGDVQIDDLWAAYREAERRVRHQPNRAELRWFALAAVYEGWPPRVKHGRGPADVEDLYVR